MQERRKVGLEMMMMMRMGNKEINRSDNWSIFHLMNSSVQHLHISVKTMSIIQQLAKTKHTISFLIINTQQT